MQSQCLRFRTCTSQGVLLESAEVRVFPVPFSFLAGSSAAKWQNTLTEDVSLTVTKSEDNEILTVMDHRQVSAKLCFGKTVGSNVKYS